MCSRIEILEIIYDITNNSHAKKVSNRPLLINYDNFEINV